MKTYIKQIILEVADVFVLGFMKEHFDFTVKTVDFSEKLIVTFDHP
jgi:hypothetical protein